MNDVNVMPRVLVNSDRSIAIYWSPRAGCSTAAKIFLQYIGQYDYNNCVYQIEHRDLYSNNLEKQYSNTDPSEEAIIRPLLCNQIDIFYKNYLRLQIVRNPYSRVISSFMKYLTITIPRQMTFEEYLINIKNDHNFEHHMLQQFMTDELDDIIYLENLETEIKRVNIKYNINLPYIKNGKLESYSNIFINKNFIYYGDKYLGFSKNYIPYYIDDNNIIYGIPSYRYFYNEYTKNLVSEIYQKDIEFFNYSYPY